MDGLNSGESPTGGDPKLLRQEAHTPVRSKASHVSSEAQDITRADADLVVEPSAKASTRRYEVSVTVVSPATQTEMSCGLAKVSVKVGAQDITRADVDLAVEPLAKADIGRYEAPMIMPSDCILTI